MWSKLHILERQGSLRDTPPQRPQDVTRRDEHATQDEPRGGGFTARQLPSPASDPHRDKEVPIDRSARSQKSAEGGR